MPALGAIAAAVLAVAAAPATVYTASQTADVVVPSGPPPKVVSSFPADGANVAAGVLVLKVTFDQPMDPDSWSYAPSGDAAFPHCLGRPRLLADQRTFALLCELPQSQNFAVEINAAPVFVNATGRHAKTTLLHFSTSDTIVRDLHDALLQAGLTDTDEPIMRWRDPGAGVSRSADPDAAGN